MRLFNPIIEEIKKFIAARIQNGNVLEYKVLNEISWPKAGLTDIVFKSETGIELGNPKDESVSFLAWTGDQSLVRDGLISLVGPDIREMEPGSLPFGKIVLIGGNGFNEENCYDRFREMDLSRYELSLKGYMMRAVSQYMREWSRVSCEAVKNGFSFSILGSALSQKLKELNYVDAVEILIVTSSAEDVRELKKTGDRFLQYINAMTKMAEEMDFECESCEFQEVCDEAEELRDMRQSLIDKGK
jgi:CO dehydrogenase/acetyl-CoA synthase beta subunit